MYCLKCGKAVEEGTKFCPYCGADLSAVSPKPAAAEKDEVKQPEPSVSPVNEEELARQRRNSLETYRQAFLKAEKNKKKSIQSMCTEPVLMIICIILVFVWAPWWWYVFGFAVFCEVLCIILHFVKRLPDYNEALRKYSGAKKAVDDWEKEHR